jgi:DNA-binding NtrC family response regulator
VREISQSALQKMMLYDWPGNVRELEHVIQRAIVMCQGIVLSDDDITLSPFQQTASPCSFQEGKAKVVHQFELNYIKVLLMAYRGNISKAAKAANKNRRAFWELIRKYGIDASSFKRPL